MKMIWAILRSQSVQPVIDALQKAGILGITRMNVTGYSKDPDLPAEAVMNSEMPKEMLMVVLPDNDVAKAVIAIRNAAKASAKAGSENRVDEGSAVNGKIFVTYVEDFYTIRTASKHTGIEEHEGDYRNHQERMC